MPRRRVKQHTGHVLRISLHQLRVILYALAAGVVHGRCDTQHVNITRQIATMCRHATCQHHETNRHQCGRAVQTRNLSTSRDKSPPMRACCADTQLVNITRQTATMWACCKTRNVLCRHATCQHHETNLVNITRQNVTNAIRGYSSQGLHKKKKNKHTLRGQSCRDKTLKEGGLPACNRNSCAW